MEKMVTFCLRVSNPGTVLFLTLKVEGLSKQQLYLLSLHPMLNGSIISTFSKRTICFQVLNKICVKHSYYTIRIQRNKQSCRSFSSNKIFSNFTNGCLTEFIRLFRF